MGNIIKKIYLNTKYEMSDKTIYGHQVLNFIKQPEIEYGKDGKTIAAVQGNTTEGFVSYRSNRFHTIEENKKGDPENKDGLLPYFANVTEDIPGYSIKLGVKPKTYYRCQLMGEKKSGYFYFYHHPTKEKLLIAINSHFYTPTT